MKAILCEGDRQLRHVVLPDPTPGPDEVVIRIRSSGVCGSDIHRFHETPESLGAAAGVIPGHDSCGDIVEVGSAVTDRQIGQRVIGFLKVGCMHCKYCAAGITAHCKQLRSIGRHINGSDAEYMTIPAWAALPIPDWMTYEEGAVLSCNFGTAYSAVMRAQPTLNDPRTMAVFGVGPVGLCALMAANELGYETIAVDLSESRLETARKLGAMHTVNGRETDTVAAIKELTHGEGFDTAIECSGSDVAQIQAIKAGGPMSKVILVGNGSAQALAPLGMFKAKEMQMEGSALYRLTEYDAMLKFLEKADFSLSALIDQDLPIEEAERAFALAEQGDSLKIMFRW